MIANNCQKCEEFDLETRSLLQKTFSADELSVLVLLLAGSLKFLTLSMQRIDRNDIRKKMHLRTNLDFNNRIIAKLLIGFEEEGREKLLAAILKQDGIAIKIGHAPCPHEEVPTTDSPGAA